MAARPHRRRAGRVPRGPRVAAHRRGDGLRARGRREGLTTSRFSDRAPSAFTRGPWAERLARLRAAGAPLLDLADHNPTAVGLTPLADPAVLRALADPRALRYTPEPLGLPEARAAVARYYADRGIEVPAERIVLTASTSEAYAHAFRLLCRPGEAFLVPEPSYPLFAPLAQAEGCRVATWPLVFDPAWDGAGDEAGPGAWRVDKDGVMAAADAAPDARALVVVNPNHPTGSFLTLDEVAWLRWFCASRDLALVSDEVFGDFRGEFGRRPAELALSLAGDDGGPFTLVFSGLSKVCGLPQLKLGWIAVGGPDDEAAEALDRIEWFADAFLSVAQPVQHALPALLAGRGAFQDAVRQRVARNRAALAATLAAIDARPGGARLVPADGGWSAVAAVPPVRSDEEWALALLEHGVVVHPGYFYDFAEPGRLVLSLLPEPEVFDRALVALAAVARD